MMKYAISILALVLPLMSSAAAETDVSAGVYSDCVRWTTINGTQHSKGFQYILNDDDSMSLDMFVPSEADKQIEESRERVRRYLMRS